jgi:hypothetical protein
MKKSRDGANHFGCCMSRRPKRARKVGVGHNSGYDPSEHSIQAKLIGRLPPLLKPGVVVMAIPNGGLRHPRVAAMLKAEGLVPGSPDLVFALEGGLAAWLEMKKSDGRLRTEQEGMRAKLLRLDHRWGMAHSYDEALEELYRMGVLK